MNSKLNFKVYVDGRSEEIQKHLFALGCKWASGDTDIKLTECPFMLVADNIILVGPDMDGFKKDARPELTVAEALALEPEPAKQPEHQFKPFDRVLARGGNTSKWRASFYSHSENDKKYVCACSWWYQCIPYEGNEHLFGTTNSPK